MRGDQLARQWRVLRRIEGSPQGVTAAEIAEFRGVSLRTAYRGLEDLEFAGFPLYDEIKQWVMGLGPEARVLSPEKLKDMVKSDLKKALVQYEGTQTILYNTKVQENRSDYGI